MARSKISELVDLTTIKDTDVLAGVDMTITENRKVPMKTLKNYVLGGVDLSNYPTFTDYATANKGGVIKSGMQFIVQSNGIPYANTITTYASYESQANGIFISKGTLDNVIAGKNLADKKYVEDYVNSLDAREVRY